jgi:GTPase SAR1 family protein
MTGLLQRPILVVGIGLSLGLWFLDSLQHSLSVLGEISLFTLISVTGGLLWFQSRSRTQPLSPTPTRLTRDMVQDAITQVDTILNQLITETPNSDTIPHFQAEISNLKGERDTESLNISVMGGKGVGKTTLIQVLQSEWISRQTQTITVKEIPALFTEVNTPDLSRFTSDLVLFVTAGDITDSEFQILSQFNSVGQRFLLLWNKQDQYLQTQQAQIFHQLCQRLEGLVQPQDINAIASAPNPIKVRQHQEDGGINEWLENQTPQIKSLTERLTQICQEEKQQLVWGNTLREVINLKLDIKNVLNAVRRDRALPIIEKYQWIAAATAFANPLPALDLLATTAISTQLIVDLGAIYQQKFTLEQGKTIAAALASQMVKLGLVEVSTQTITHFLKTNAITFVAGGLAQGVSAGYFTRIAGLSLIESFQNQDTSLDKGEGNLGDAIIGKTLQKVFQQNQQIPLMQSFIQQAISHILPESAQTVKL